MYGYSTGCAPSTYGYRGYPLALRSQNVATGYSMDDFKAKLEEQTLGVANKWWLAGAAGLAAAFYFGVVKF